MDEEDLIGWKRCCLRSWHPRPTAKFAVLIFFILGLILLIIGTVLIVNTKKVIEIVTRYDITCEAVINCEIDIDVSIEMEEPIFVFYEIHGLHQNHRRYIRSQSLKQLAGNEISLSEAEVSCNPIVRNKDIHKATSITGSKLDSDDVAYPCGLIAYTFFNDTFTFPKEVEVDEKNIIWNDDVGKKFKNLPKDKQNKQWQDIENPHFVNWMRTSGLPNFRKLWGRIDKRLGIGTYTVTIKNNYNVKAFEGSKYLVISTASPFGGKNYFLSITYLVMGSIFVLIALFFVVKYCTSGRKFGTNFKEE